MKMSDIKIVRLITGEDILCNYSKSDADGVVLKDPAVLVSAGQGKLGLIPWLPYAETEDGVAVEERHIVFVVQPHKELENQYTSAITGIVVPSASESAAFGESKIHLAT